MNGQSVCRSLSVYGQMDRAAAGKARRRPRASEKRYGRRGPLYAVPQNTAVLTS